MKPVKEDRDQATKRLFGQAGLAQRLRVLLRFAAASGRVSCFVPLFCYQPSTSPPSDFSRNHSECHRPLPGDSNETQAQSKAPDLSLDGMDLRVPFLRRRLASVSFTPLGPVRAF